METKYIIQKGSKKVDRFVLNELPVKQVHTTDARWSERNAPVDRFQMIERVVPNRMFPIRKNSWITFYTHEDAQEYLDHAKESIEQDERFSEYIKEKLLNHLSNLKIKKEKSWK